MTKTQYRLTMWGIIGFTWSGWFTIQTNGFYAPTMLIWCGGMVFALLCFLGSISIKSEEPHKRFKSHGVVL